MEKHQNILILFNTINENGRVYLEEHTTVKDETFALLSAPEDTNSIDQMFAEIKLEKNQEGVYIKDIEYLRNSDTGKLTKNAKEAKKLMKKGARLVPAGFGTVVGEEIHDYKMTGVFLTMDPANYKLPEGINPEELNLTPEDVMEIKQLNGWISKEDSPWTDVKNPPKESGRYWCYIEEQNYLGPSHYQGNCSYNKEDNIWSDNLESKKVTHWMPLIDPPSNSFGSDDTDIIYNKGETAYIKDIEYYTEHDPDDDECGQCEGTRLVTVKAPLDYMPDQEFPCPQCTAVEGEILNQHGFVNGEWVKLEITMRADNIFIGSYTKNIPEEHKEVLIKLLNSMINEINNT